MIRGIYKRCIYEKNGYIVGLIKINSNDLDDSLNNRIVTFTGNFVNLNIDDNLSLNGEFIYHKKYGEQFLVSSYTINLPDEKNSIITFLSSDLFKGIGENKARVIYDSLGDDCINIILSDKNRLVGIKGLSKKNIDSIYDVLVTYKDSTDIILKLTDIGFNTKESSLLYSKYKDKVLDIVNDNIYSLINDELGFNYKKIDFIALNNNYDKCDDRRVKASIVYCINNYMFSSGDTYISYSYLKNCLDNLLGFSISNDCFDNLLIDLTNDSILVINDDKYYLKSMYDSEINVCNRLVYLNNKKDDKISDIDKYLEIIMSDNNIRYDESQIKAIKSSYFKNFSIITGGPGTGKTTIIKSIVSLYSLINHVSYSDMCDDVYLLAPTGKAAKRMNYAVNYPSSTIHRFLRWNKDNNKFSVNERNKIDCKMVIIDEASMVDIYLMDSLLKGLRFDTKIILVGDVNQLPSVSPGNLLKDLIDSDCFNVIRLEKLYRQKDNSNIISLASNINNGIYDSSIFNVNDDLTFIKCDSYNLMDKLSEIVNCYKDYNYNDFCILCPMYKTINGIDNLNLIVRDIINPYNNQEEINILGVKYREGDKVIELVNMLDDNVFNGDIGIITKIDNKNGEVFVDFDSNIVKYTKNTFSNFSLGYVISIHKSQGSEFKVCCIICLNEFNRMNYRKLIYTGVTRCKENLYILGEDSAIIKSINNNYIIDRKTSLKELVYNRYN